jgi:magnesium transporter
MTQPLHQRTDAILRRLLRKRAAAGVRKVLAKTRPEDIAAAMEVMTRAERRRLFEFIEDPESQAAVLSAMADDLVREATAEMAQERVVDLLGRMDPDDATDVVEALPDELRMRVLAELAGEEHEEVAQLLAWPSDSAGGLMSPLVFKMPETASCGEAIDALQRSHEEFETVFYIYVVDAQDRLVGVLSLRSLLIHPPRTPLPPWSRSWRPISSPSPRARTRRRWPATWPATTCSGCRSSTRNDSCWASSPSTTWWTSSAKKP